MTKQVTVAAARVLDESGSMGRVRDATISGMNEWLMDQQRASGTKMILLDTIFATKVRSMIGPRPIEDVRPLTYEEYEPDGWTALYDAVMATIKKLETYEADSYLVVIVTDGDENRSKETTLADVREAIRLREGSGKWTFTYVGAHADAWRAAQALGVQSGNTARVGESGVALRSAFVAMSDSTARYRSDTARGQRTNDYAAEVQATAPELNQQAHVVNLNDVNAATNLDDLPPRP